MQDAEFSKPEEALQSIECSKPEVYYPAMRSYVWNISGTSGSICDLTQASVMAYLPGRKKPVITSHGCYSCYGKVKPRRSHNMTYKQLAEWLARGFGEWTTPTAAATDSACDVSSSDFAYSKRLGNTELASNLVLIRSWDSLSWSEPDKDIYDRDCAKRPGSLGGTQAQGLTTADAKLGAWPE